MWFNVAGEILLREDTNFEYLNICNRAKEHGIIAANGYKLIMGHEGEKNSLVTETEDTKYLLNIAGGSCFNNATLGGKKC